MSDTIIQNVKLLLEADPKTRDDDGYLSSLYLYHFYNGSPHEFILDNIQITLVKTRQKLQNKYPNLQASKEVKIERQKHNVKFKQEYKKAKSQEKPENLQNTCTVAEDKSYMFQKESFSESV